jgi:hypothetical protein
LTVGIPEIIAIASLAAPVLVQLLRLLNAKIANEKASAVMSAAEQAVLFVEEVAAANPDLVQKGSGKLTAAAGELMKKYPKLSDPEAKALIRSTLPKLGLGAAAKKSPISQVLNGQP